MSKELVNFASYKSLWQDFVTYLLDFFNPLRSHYNFRNTHPPVGVNDLRYQSHRERSTKAHFGWKSKVLNEENHNNLRPPIKF